MRTKKKYKYLTFSSIRKVIFIWVSHVLFLCSLANASYKSDDHALPSNREQESHRMIEREDSESEKLDFNKIKIKSRYEEYLSKYPQSTEKFTILFKKSLNLINQAENKILNSKEGLSKISELESAIKILNVIINTDLSSQPNEEINRIISSDALYFLAKSYDLKGESDKSKDILIELIEKYPSSSNHTEAAFRVAEYLYSKKDYKKSSKYYSEVLLDKTSKLFNNASYMMAWSLYKNSKYQQSAIQFKDLLDSLWESNDQSKKSSKLKDDAIRALALTLDQDAAFRNLSDAMKVLEKSNYESFVYRRLALLYENQKRYQDASEVYWLYSKKYPNDSIGFSFANYSNELLKGSGLKNLYIKDEERFINQYGKDSDFFSNLEPDKKIEASKTLEKKLLSVSEYHYKNSLVNKRYINAIHWHKKFLKNNPDSKFTGNVAYALGDLHEKSGDNESAYQVYFDLAYPKKNQHSESSAFSAFLIAKNLSSNESKKNQIDFNGLVENIDNRIRPKNQISSWTYKYYLNAYLLALEYPSHKNLEGTILSVTQTALKNKLWPMASSLSKYFMALKKVNLNSELKLKLAIMSAQTEFNQGRYRLAIKNYTQASNYKQLKIDRDDKTISQNEVEQQLIKSKFLLAKKLENNKSDKKEYIELYEELSVQDVNSDIKRKSYLSLIEENITSDELDKARSSISAFRKSFPTDPMQLTLATKMALIYEKNKDLRNAFEYMKYLYENSHDIEEKKSANWKLAQWKERQGDKEQAIRWYKKYYHSFSKPTAKNMEAQNKIQILYYDLSKKDGIYTQKRKFWLRKMISTYNKNKISKTDREKTLAAQATVSLADYSYGEFINKKISRPVAQSFRSKKKLMDKAIKLYKKSINFNIDTVNSHAYFHLAEMYGDLAKSMLDAPIPNDLPELEKEEYKVLLEEQAYPFEEKSIAIHEKNSQLTSNGFYNKSIEGSFKKLGSLLPVRYGKSEIELDYINEY